MVFLNFAWGNIAFTFNSINYALVGKAMLSYNLDQTDIVQIELFNMLGSKVGMLINEKQSKGEHNQNFSSTGLGLSAGVYFVRTTIGGKTFTERLTIAD